LIRGIHRRGKQVNNSANRCERPVEASGTITERWAHKEIRGVKEAILGIVFRKFTPIIIPTRRGRREGEPLVRDHRGRVLQADGERQLGRGCFSEFEGTNVSVTVSVMSVGIPPTVGEKSLINGRFRARKPVLKTGRSTRPTHSEDARAFYRVCWRAMSEPGAASGTACSRVSSGSGG
jgi:hypothetical protein